MCYCVITLCVVFGVMVLYKRFVLQRCTEFGFVSIQVVIQKFHMSPIVACEASQTCG